MFSPGTAICPSAQVSDGNTGSQPRSPSCTNPSAHNSGGVPAGRHDPSAATSPGLHSVCGELPPAPDPALVAGSSAPPPHDTASITTKTAPRSTTTRIPRRNTGGDFPKAEKSEDITTRSAPKCAPRGSWSSECGGLDMTGGHVSGAQQPLSSPQRSPTQRNRQYDRAR